MTNLRVADPKVFDAHLDDLDDVGAVFKAELQEGIDECEFGLRRLRVSLEASEEMLDVAQRELWAATDNEDRDFDQIEHILDEVEELTRECQRKRRRVEDGTVALRQLQVFAEKAKHQFMQAVFRAQVAMTENKARFRTFHGLAMEGPSRRMGSPTEGTRKVMEEHVPARTESPVRTHAMPQLPNGLEWVSLDALDWGQIDEGLEFKKASREAIRTTLRTFVEAIVPMLSVDRALGPDLLASLDARTQRMPGDADSLVGAWERLISGSDLVAIDARQGDQYGYIVLSGRHRILVARDLGLTHIPAIVSRQLSEKGSQS